MTERQKILFIVLSFCGTLCILGGLVAAVYLYEQNAAALALPDQPGALPHAVSFGIFAWSPCLLTFAVGIVMMVAGVRIAVKN